MAIGFLKNNGIAWSKNIRKKLLLCYCNAVICYETTQGRGQNHGSKKKLRQLSKEASEEKACKIC